MGDGKRTVIRMNQVMKRTNGLPVLGALVVGLVLLVAGCDLVESPTVGQQPVVEAYLVEGDTLPGVRLSRTAPVDASSGGQEAITGATVMIERISTDGAPGETTMYRVDSAGVYVPDGSAPVVEGGATYRFRATLPGGQELSAETIIPTDLALVRAENTESTFLSPNQPSFTLTRATVRDAPVVFIFTTVSLLDFDAMTNDELIDKLTPFYEDGFDADDDDIRDLRVNASPIVNEGNYDNNEDGTITTDYPWIALAFCGRNEVSVSVLDRAMYDYIRTVDAQQGALSPGEIPNIVDNIDGGTGIFGSYTRIASTIDIACPDNE